MPAPTIYLSRLIGVVALIIAAAVLADKAMVAAAIGHLEQEPVALLLLGFIQVACGAGIVLGHNVWSKGFWPLVVTLTGWALLARGVMVLFVPPDVMAAFVAGAHVADFYYLYAAIPLMLGAYLSLRGFSAAAPIKLAVTPTTPPPTKPPPPKARSRRRR